MGPIATGRQKNFLRRGQRNYENETAKADDTPLMPTANGESRESYKASLKRPPPHFADIAIQN